MIVSAHPLRKPPWGKRIVGSERGGALATGYREGPGEWRHMTRSTEH